ncbi:MAG: hypothetical protein ACPGVO_17195 [Spirulinaceae cyanobacterium]
MKELLLIILICGIAYAAWSLWQEQQGNRGTGERVHPDLLRAAGGNRGLAKRTLNYLRQKYPDKSEQWCREKAIYDLYRDHGSPSNTGRFQRRASSMSRRELKENLWIAGLALWVSHSFLSLIDRFRP